MEAGGLVAEVGWTELDFSFQGGEESEIMAQLFGSFPSSYAGEGGSQELPWSDQASSAYCDSIGGGSLAAPSSSAYEDCCYLINSSEALGISSCGGGAPAADHLGMLVQDQGAAELLNVFSNHSLVHENNYASMKQVVDASACATNNKRKHFAEDLDDQTRGRKRARKGAKKANKQSEDHADLIPIASGSPTSCCTSDSESNGSQEECADADARPKASKARAARGAATEPQSIYARKRRERINERLKILQNLVPNGTKVDISTMLEEAVHYVKFLQLQIKLLSSDDTWMYAPIAYNGMDIGIDLNMDR